MILHGIEVKKLYWNDKEVTEEEYLELDAAWKKKAQEAESEWVASEKKFRTTKSKK